MPDEKKDHDLDADILQSKADILKALRAAGNSASNEPNVGPEEASDPIFEEESLDEDIIDLADDESEDPALDELISDFPEEELVEKEPVRIMPFEESQQYNALTNGSPENTIESPIVPKEVGSDAEQLRRDNRHLTDRASTLLEENTRLKADLQDYLQTGNQVQQFRSELSEAEVALSREHSRTRLLETKVNEIESLKALLEQDCRSFTEQIEQLQQEKKQSLDALKRIQEEQSDNRERTGRQIVDLNQQIERLSEDSETLKKDYAQTRQEYEAYQSQTGGEIAILTEQQDALQQEVGGLRAACDDHNSTKERIRSEIRDYETKVQHLDAELSALRERRIHEQNELTAQLQQEKQKSEETLEQLRQEHSAYREETSGGMDKLNQRIERISEKADLAKRAYEELRDEYEAHQSQAGGEISTLTERRDDLQQEADSLRQTVDSLNQEVAALRENASVLSETSERLESVRAELDIAKSKLSQEQEERSALEQEARGLRAACDENNSTNEQLQSEIRGYAAKVQHLDTELSALGEQHNQERGTFSEQLQQEKEQFGDNLERLQKEYSDYREQTGRETVELKMSHERARQEYQARQLQADGEITNLKQQLQETSAAHQELKELRDHMDSESSSKEHLQLEVNALESGKDQLTNELSELRTQLEQTEISNRVQIDEIEKQKQLLQEQFEILQEKGKVEFQNQLEALNKRAEQDAQALEQLGETKALLQEAQDEAARLQKENTALQLKLGRLAAQQQELAEPTAVSTDRGAATVEPPAGRIEAETPPQIPQYNLAEQILSEHRRSTASRRKRIEPAAPKAKEGSIENIVKQYIGEPVTAGQTKAEPTTLCHNLWDDDSLTAFQRELLQEIIQRDISEYCKN